MKNSRSLFAALAFVVIVISCKKNDPVLSAPVLTTAAATKITSFTASTGGTVTSDGGSAVTARGVCWSIGTTPTTADSKTSDGMGLADFTSSVTGLKESTAYNLRAYATNTSGTAYGNLISFTSLPITDIDGNVYHSVTIGSQVWMVENLKVTKYNDGTPIPLVSSPATWIGSVAGAYCAYDNVSTNKEAYGALYNWYAVATDKLCPAGWHVPTESDWNKLITSVGVSGKIKETGATHWQSPNTGATNESGFTALPGGIRGIDGSYLFIGQVGYWWSRSELSTGGAANHGAIYNGGDAFFGNNNSRTMGYSVRCIKD